MSKSAELKIQRRQKALAKKASYLAQIKDTIIETIFETGHPPHAHTGAIQYGPLAGKEWSAVNVWLFKYHAQFLKKQREDCKFSSIPTFINVYAIITPDTVAETIYAKFKATGNKDIPQEGIVQYGPYAGRVSWEELSEWTHEFFRRKPDCGFNSLETFISAYNPTERPINSRLKLFLIEETVKQTADAGYKLSISKDLLQYGPYRGQTSSFNIDAWLRKYAKNNPDCGFNSLPSFIKTLKIQDYETLKLFKKTGKPALPIKEITTATEAFNISAAHIKRTGQVPDQARGIVSSSFERAKVQQINHSIKSGQLEGLSDMFKRHITPANYKQFLLFSGLAQLSQDGKELLPKLDNL